MGYRRPDGSGARCTDRVIQRLVSAGLVLLTSRWASAQEKLELDYQVPPNCPERRWFSERLSGSEVPSTSQLRVAVRVVPAAAGWQGTLDVVSAASGASNTPEPLHARTLDGSECHEVLSALALSLSLFLDTLRERPALAGEPPPAPAPPSPVLPRDAAPPARPTAAQHWGFGVFGGITLRTGLGSAFDSSGRVGVLAAPAADRHELYELGLDFGGGGRARSPSAVGEVTWEHRWWSIRGNACRWRYGPLPWLHLTPCLAAQIGRYEAQLVSQRAGAQWFAWLEPGLQVQVGKGIFARWEGGVTIPIDALGVELDGQELFRQSVGVATGLSIGLVFSSS